MLVSLAWKNLTRQKRRSLLLGAGIGLGTAIIALLSGFTQTMVVNARENLSQSSGGHIFMTGQEVTASGRHVAIIRDPAFLERHALDLGLKDATFSKRSSAQTVLLFGSASRSQNAVGIEAGQVAALSERLVVAAGDLASFGPGTIVIPRLTAEKLGATAGDSVYVRTQTITGQENVETYRIAAVADDPAALGAAVAFFRLEDLNRLVAIPEGQCQALAISLRDPEKSDEIAQRLYSSLEGIVPLVPLGSGPSDPMIRLLQTFQGPALRGMDSSNEQAWAGNMIKITTISELMQPVMDIIGTLKLISSTTFIVLLVIILVGISNTFQMILLERVREIGTLRALGYQRTEVLALFLLEAGLLTVAASLIGLAVGGLLGGALGLVHWGRLPFTTQIFLSNGRLGSYLSMKSSAFLVLALIAVGLAAALGPARKAAALEPAQALRTQN
jgi:putative ABC transport system permease protein